jgi:uncharacterized ferritin-like protein (DUF455 family)/bacterioferritin (cytochrome b1)
MNRFENLAQPKLSVDDAARLIKRLYLIEREVMRALGGWHLSISNWELKALVPRQWWQDSLHADALRERVLELRYPKRDVDTGHDPRLVEFLEQVTRAQTDAEFALGIYHVVKPALMAAYRSYLARVDELDDAPSVYHLSHILLDEQEHLDRAAAVLAELPADEIVAAQPWLDYLRASLASIGGLLGDSDGGDPPSTHPCAGRPAYQIPPRAARDPRFLPATVESPLRRPTSPREEQIWYAIDHANEVWAAEMPGAMMWEWRDMPWAFYKDLARWGYDEMRHSLMGIRRLEGWGFKTGVDYPMVGDPYHAVLEKGGNLLDVLALLHYFERDAPAHRQRAKRRFDELEDSTTSQDTDYDWADEAIHLRYGYTWLQHILGTEAKERLPGLLKQAGAMWDEWLAERWERGEDGYGPFMERIEARIAEAEASARGA